LRSRERRASWYAKGEKYPEELLKRATRLVFESGRPICMSRVIWVSPSETLRAHVRRVEANEGRRKDVLSDGDREEIRKPRRDNFELPRVSESSKKVFKM
jgi:transposase-like protein